MIDGLGVFDYSVNPVVFKAGAQLAEGANTDLENGVGDGIRDLNGTEYALAAVGASLRSVELRALGADARRDARAVVARRGAAPPSPG